MSNLQRIRRFPEGTECPQQESIELFVIILFYCIGSDGEMYWKIHVINKPFSSEAMFVCTDVKLFSQLQILISGLNDHGFLGEKYQQQRCNIVHSFVCLNGRGLVQIWRRVCLPMNQIEGHLLGVPTFAILSESIYNVTVISESREQ